MNLKIGVFDSGVGGLTILEELKKVLPNEKFIYYQDSKNNPYGEKNDEELMRITRHIVDDLKNRGCKLIVIACNTATTKCMKKLRILYPDLIFVGTVPAIKVACDHHYRNTLVMATPATIEAERTMELVMENQKKNQNIYLVSCPGLAHAIEKKNQNQVKKLLSNYLEPYKNKNIDSIVLGCTHYPYIKEEILQEIPNAKFIDGAEGVAKEVKNQLKKNNLWNDTGDQEVEMIIR